MKKILLSLIFLMSVLASFGQTSANIQEGYYRIQNVQYSRYMSILDNTGDVYRDRATVVTDLYAVRTLQDNETNNISSNPATVIYISPSSGGYVFSAQGIDTQKLTSHTLYIRNQSGNTNAYYLYASESGIRRYLQEVPKQRNLRFLPDSGYVDASDTEDYWYITPIQSNSSNFFGFSPKLQSNGKYYQTFYAQFPFRIVSSGVKVYYISNLFWDGHAVYREFNEGDIVPGATPVLVECSSANASENQIQPVSENVNAPASNYLSGVYFNYYFDEVGENFVHNNRTAFNASTMRVLRVQSDGSLAFVNNPSEAANGTYYLPANEAYLSVPAWYPATVPLMSYSDYLTGIKNVKADTPSSTKNSPIYTIGGVRVDNTNNLPHGVYIQNGKKIAK